MKTNEKGSPTPARMDAGLNYKYEHRKLTKKEEIQAFIRYREFGDQDAFDLLVYSMMPLVPHIIRGRSQCQNNANVFDDCQQVGYLALVDSIRLFDYTRGLRLITYAWRAIQSRISYHLACERSIIKIPQVVKDFTLTTELEDWCTELGFNGPTYEEPFDFKLDELPTRDKWIIQQSYLKGRTAVAIGIDLGISRERVRQIRARALKKLKDVHCKNNVE